MIKMVCSDLDGTLLQYGKKIIEGEIFDEKIGRASCRERV